MTLTTRTRSLEAGQSNIILSQEAGPRDERNYLNRLDQRTHPLTVLSFPTCLPIEIIAKIFISLQGCEPTTLPPRRTKSPWVLRWVCSLWRQVALAEDLLWSNLFVEELPSKSGGVMAAHWIPLLWSPNQMLSVSLNLGSSSIHNGLVLCEKLAPYFHRLKKFSLDAPSELLPAVISGHSRPFDRLGTLVLNVRAEWYLNQITPLTVDEQPVTLFNTSKKLKTVIFTAFPASGIHILAPYQLPWSQLTSLAFLMVRLPVRTLKEILQHCINLVSFTFTSFYDRSELHSLSTPAPDVFLPNLQTLNVVLQDGSSYWDIFELLHVPSLNIFSMDNPDAVVEFPWDQTEFVNMITRSGSCVQSLNLSGRIELSFESLLTILPDLVDIVLSNLTPIPEAMVDMMISGDIVQRLKHLECFVESPTSLLKLLENRLTASAKSEKYYKTFSSRISYITPGTEEEIEEMSGVHRRLRSKLGKSEDSIVFLEIFSKCG